MYPESTIDNAIKRDIPLSKINSLIDRYPKHKNGIQTCVNILTQGFNLMKNCTNSKDRLAQNQKNGEMFENVICLILKWIIDLHRANPGYKNKNFLVLNINDPEDYKKAKKFDIHIKRGGTKFAEGIDVIHLEGSNGSFIFQAIQCKNMSTKLRHNSLDTMYTFIENNKSIHMCIPLVIVSDDYPGNLNKFPNIKMIKYSDIIYGLNKMAYLYILNNNKLQKSKKISEQKYRENNNKLDRILDSLSFKSVKGLIFSYAEYNTELHDIILSKSIDEGITYNEAISGISLLLHQILCKNPGAIMLVMGIVFLLKYLAL